MNPLSDGNLLALAYQTREMEKSIAEAVRAGKPSDHVAELKGRLLELRRALVHESTRCALDCATLFGVARTDFLRGVIDSGAHMVRVVDSWLEARQTFDAAAKDGAVPAVVGDALEAAARSLDNMLAKFADTVARQRARATAAPAQPRPRPSAN